MAIRAECVASVTGTVIATNSIMAVLSTAAIIVSTLVSVCMDKDMSRVIMYRAVVTDCTYQHISVG